MITFSNQEAYFKAEGINFRKGQKKIKHLPETAVAVYSRQLFNYMKKAFNTRAVGYISNANLEKDIFIANYKGKEITLFMSYVGGPSVSVDIEELAPMGVKKFIFFGNCGVLHEHIKDLEILIPTEAFRDEGTSYHYVPDSPSIAVNGKYIPEFVNILKERKYNYIIGKTWTTDGFYRETPEKIDYYKSKGCICVEMEAATIAAVCKYKKLEHFTFFYAGDNLGGEEWDKRSLRGGTKLDEKSAISQLAMELAYKISI